MAKIGMILVFAISLLGVLPPLFNKGGIFNIQYQSIDPCGKVVLMDGLYFDNVFFTITFFVISFLGISIPFLFDKLPVWLKRLSIVVGSWFASGLMYELMNFQFPEIVLNSPEDSTLFVKYLVTFIISSIFIITHETWIKQKKLED